MLFLLSKFVELYKNMPPYGEKTSFRKLWLNFVPWDKKYPCWDGKRPTPYIYHIYFNLSSKKWLQFYYILYTVFIIKNIVYNVQERLYVYCIKYIVYKALFLYSYILIFLYFLYIIYYIVYIKHYL